MPNRTEDAPKIPTDVIIVLETPVGMAEFNKRFSLPAIPRPGDTCRPVDPLDTMIVESVVHRFEDGYVDIRFPRTALPSDESWKSAYAMLSDAGWDLSDASGSVLLELDL